MLTIERGDLMIFYTFSAGDPGDRWYPGEPPHVEDLAVEFRGRELENISERNMRRLEEEIAAYHG